MIYRIIRERENVIELTPHKVDARDSRECKKALEQNGYEPVRISGEYGIAIVK